MRRSSIYALCDPFTDEIRYVGKTVVPLGIRVSQHVSAAAKGQRTHLHCWIRSLKQRPKIKALQIVPYDFDAEAEMRTIAVLRAKGYRLVNQTDGGEGKKGCFHSTETKEKIRQANLGRKMPPFTDEARKNMAAAQRGKKHTVEHKAKIALAGIGRPQTRFPTIATCEHFGRKNVGFGLCQTC